MKIGGFKGDQFSLPGVGEAGNERVGTEAAKEKADGYFERLGLIDRSQFRKVAKDYVCQLAIDEYGSNEQRFLKITASKLLSACNRSMLDAKKATIDVASSVGVDIDDSGQSIDLGKLALDLKSYLRELCDNDEDCSAYNAGRRERDFGSIERSLPVGDRDDE